jgi:hypothetical protein
LITLFALMILLLLKNTTKLDGDRSVYEIID